MHAPSFYPRPRAQLPQLAFAVLMHLAFFWALLHLLGHTVIDILPEAVDVQIIKPEKRPEPPPPQPLPPPPEFVPPPPLYVPPPEVHVKPPVHPPVVHATVTVPPPAPVRIAPVAPAAPPAPVRVAPPAPKPVAHLARPARLDAAHCTRPDYPPLAARAEAVGTSRIRFRVDAVGRVTGAQLLAPSGHDRAHRALDRAAIDALSRCRFTPGRDDAGQPVGGSATVEYVWRLDQ